MTYVCALILVDVGVSWSTDLMSRLRTDLPGVCTYVREFNLLDFYAESTVGKEQISSIKKIVFSRKITRKFSGKNLNSQVCEFLN